MRRGICFAAMLLLVEYGAAQATTWNVPGSAATIQGGIDLAVTGDTVLVGPATWSGAGNVNLSFGGVDLVLLSSDGRDLTTINCGSANRAFIFLNGESASSVVQGFTIRDGSATTGGGILVDEASPVIRDCRFVSCYASNHGGAADLQVTSASLFEDCVFDSNSTSDVSLESCTFERNAGTDGGAVVDQSGLPTSFESCTFVENHATSTGGALRLGGARHTFTDCLFDMNSCDLGGTMYVTLGDAVLQNCTVTRTTSDSASAALVVVNSGSDIDLTNTIIYGSLSGAAVQCLNYGDITPVCSDLFGNAHGDWDGCVVGDDLLNGNFSADPLFCDPDSGDFTLDAASPCLDAPGCGLVGAYGQGCTIYTSVAGSGSMPSGALALFVSPNPSVGGVSLRYAVPQSGPSSIHVYDVRGRVIRSMEARSSTGQLSWDGTDLSGRGVAPGVYFIRLSDGDRSETKRVTLIR